MPEKKDLDRADSFDKWADILEAQKPKKSAAGIIMLRKGATIIRLQIARIKELEKDIEILGTILNKQEK